MADTPFRPMQVGQILDKTTVVVVGPGVDGLEPDDDLQILAVGRDIPNVGVPLVVPKALVSVTSVAGPYAVARTKTYDVQVTTNPAFDLGLIAGRTRTETKRYQLTVDEAQMVGNPASTPVAIGDPIIRPGELPKFLEHLRRQAQIGQPPPR